MDQHRATVGHPRAPVADVGTGGGVAVGAVDVEHVDRSVHVDQSGVGELADVTDPIGHSGAFEVGEEHRVIVGCGVGVAVDLLRSAIVAGMGIDGDHRDVGSGSAGEDDRRTALKAADLDDGALRSAAAGGVVERCCLARRHPPLDVGDASGDGGQVRGFGTE